MDTSKTRWWSSIGIDDSQIRVRPTRYSQLLDHRQTRHCETRYGVSLSSGGPDAEILLGRRTLLSSKPTAMAAQELWTSWDDFMAQRNEDGQEARQEIPNFHHDINHHDGDVHD